MAIGPSCNLAVRMIAVALGLLVDCATPRAQDGATVIAELQSRFRRLENLEARFEKRHFWKLVDQTQEVKGKLYVEKPNRFRFETPMQTVATDGKTAWNYVPENHQVILSDYETVKADRSYEKLLFDLILLGGYDDRFTPEYAGEEKVDGKSADRVDLKSRDADNYITGVRLWVDREGLVRKVEYRNINEDVTTYVLSDFRVNKSMKPELFTLHVPEHTEVVDLR